MNPEPARTVDILASRSSRSPGVRLQPFFLFMWLPSRLKPACCRRYDIAIPLSDLKCRQALFEMSTSTICVISLIVIAVCLLNSQGLVVCVCFLAIHSGHQVRWTYQPGSHRRKVRHCYIPSSVAVHYLKTELTYLSSQSPGLSIHQSTIIARVISLLLVLYYRTGRPGSSEVPRNPLTRWDVSSIPANGIFLKLKNKNKNARRVEDD